MYERKFKELFEIGDGEHAPHRYRWNVRVLQQHSNRSAGFTTAKLTARSFVPDIQYVILTLPSTPPAVNPRNTGRLRRPRLTFSSSSSFSGFFSSTVLCFRSLVRLATSRSVDTSILRRKLSRNVWRCKLLRCKLSSETRAVRVRRCRFNASSQHETRTEFPNLTQQQKFEGSRDFI